MKRTESGCCGAHGSISRSIEKAAPLLGNRLSSSRARMITRTGGARALTLPSGSIRSVEGAFYEPAGQDTYVATAATVGPWSPDAQHGGPPSALAARALERHEPDERQRLARVAIDILRPVPVGKLSVRTRMVRPGRRIALVEAVMEADGQEELHARGWRTGTLAGAGRERVGGAGAR